MNSMATKQEIKDAIDALLNLSAVGRLLQLNSDTCERAYEAYVLSLCAESVTRCGGTAVLTGIASGPNPPIVIFRGAPGSMASRAQDFCFVDCALGRKRFEIHVDVTYEGQSGAHHEIDVSVCAKDHANDVRTSGRTPRTNKNLIAAIECKFYESTPGVSLARTFVGLLRDCSTNQLKVFASNRSSSGLDGFLSTTWGPETIHRSNAIGLGIRAPFRLLRTASIPPMDA